MALRGVQLYDWTVLHGEWIAEWGNRRNTRLRDLHPLPTWDFIPTSEYWDWYVRSFGHMLGLLAYVPQGPAAPQPPAPQPPAPQVPPQHAVFEPVPYYVPQPQDQSHGSPSQSSQCVQPPFSAAQHSDHSQHSHHSQHSQHSHHSQHSQHRHPGQSS
ncbi:hypothetical protein AHAS_Ahas11G0256400 [Arachis hypogaea]